MRHRNRSTVAAPAASLVASESVPFSSTSFKRLVAFRILYVNPQFSDVSHRCTMFGCQMLSILLSCWILLLLHRILSHLLDSAFPFAMFSSFESDRSRIQMGKLFLTSEASNKMIISISAKISSNYRWNLFFLCNLFTRDD